MSGFDSPWKEVLDRYFAVLSPASRVLQQSGQQGQDQACTEGLGPGAQSLARCRG